MVEAGQTAAREVLDACAQFESMGTPVLGAVIARYGSDSDADLRPAAVEAEDEDEAELEADNDDDDDADLRPRRPSRRRPREGAATTAQSTSGRPDEREPGRAPPSHGYAARPARLGGARSSMSLRTPGRGDRPGHPRAVGARGGWAALERGPAGWPLTALLVLYPLWWALGMGTLIIFVLALPMAVHLHAAPADPRAAGLRAVVAVPGLGRGSAR